MIAEAALLPLFVLMRTFPCLHLFNPHLAIYITPFSFMSYEASAFGIPDYPVVTPLTFYN